MKEIWKVPRSSMKDHLNEHNNMLDLENGKSMDEDLGGLEESEMSKDIGKNNIGKESMNKDADRGDEYGTVKI